MRTFAFIHTGALGDFLQTFPVLEAVRREHPGAKVTIIGRPEWSALALAADLADADVSAEACGLHRLFADNAEAPAVPEALTKVECIVSFLPHPSLKRNLAKLTSATVITATSFPQPGQCNQPVAQFVYDQVAAPLGLPPAEAAPRITVGESSSAARKGAAAVDDHTVAIVPGSGSREKNWPLERFVRLAEQLAGDGMSPLWVLGPAEMERVEFTPPPSARSLVNEPIVTVAAALSHARCLVGNDSGPSHLAAALGTPTVVLFGPSEARVWSPRGEHVRCLAAPSGDVAAIAGDRVLESVRSLCGIASPASSQAK